MQILHEILGIKFYSAASLDDFLDNRNSVEVGKGLIFYLTGRYSLDIDGGIMKQVEQAKKDSAQHEGLQNVLEGIAGELAFLQKYFGGTLTQPFFTQAQARILLQPERVFKKIGVRADFYKGLSVANLTVWYPSKRQLTIGDEAYDGNLIDVDNIPRPGKSKTLHIPGVAKPVIVKGYSFGSE